jgi:hypothetical protein
MGNHGLECFNAMNGDHSPPPEPTYWIDPATGERYEEDPHDRADENVCEWCGEPGTDEDPLVTSIISPPVSGYQYEEMRGHARCCSAAALSMVM